jgi:hypothetical protein
MSRASDPKVDSTFGIDPMLPPWKSASYGAENRVHFSARCASPERPARRLVNSSSFAIFGIIKAPPQRRPIPAAIRRSSTRSACHSKRGPRRAGADEGCHVSGGANTNVCLRQTGILLPLHSPYLILGKRPVCPKLDRSYMLGPSTRQRQGRQDLNAAPLSLEPQCSTVELLPCIPRKQVALKDKFGQCRIPANYSYL